MKNNHYLRLSNKKGYTVFLMMSVLLLIIFWRMSSESFELVNYLNFQKTEMDNSGIKLSQEDCIYFELN